MSESSSNATDLQLNTTNKLIITGSKASVKAEESWHHDGVSLRMRTVRVPIGAREELTWVINTSKSRLFITKITSQLEFILKLQ